MLYYVPLELYKERYTIQWSAPVTGWLERNWLREKIPYTRIDSEVGPLQEQEIETGVVLDPLRRTQHSFAQVLALQELAVNEMLTSDDIIFFDDFWHPGIEALPYTFQQLKIKPKMFAFCHAQSVDEYDFTHKMRGWMRPFEMGIGKILSGIFVNSNILRDLLVQYKIQNQTRVHVIGHIFSEQEVRSRFPHVAPTREDTVIFTSRWDKEKNPQFFLDVANKVLAKKKDIKFVVCTPYKRLRSNSASMLTLLELAMATFPENIILKEGLTKEEYYNELLKAKIMLNTASQDWVSIGLLEASVAGCYPLCPNFRSFPQALRGNTDFMYERFNSVKATNHIRTLIKTPSLWSAQSMDNRSWIHKRHNDSWARMTNIMFDDIVIPVKDYT
jgi:glycosyltransferase involved in cell wall biosynthesis